MVIGIDGNEANISNRVGVNKYAFEIIWGVYKLLPKNTDLIVIVYLKKNPLEDMPKETKNFKYKVLSGGKVWIMTRLTPYLWKNLDKIQVFFTPSHYLPIFITIPKVCTITDLGYLENSAQFKKYDFWQLKYWTAISVSISKYLLTISNTTKNDIVRHYPDSEKKVIISYPGADKYSSADYSVYKINEVKQKYSIGSDYILYLGTLKPSKNIDGLLIAFHAWKKRNEKTANSDIVLVIAGKKGWLYENIFHKVKELKLEKDVVFTDFVEEKNKAALIKGAKIFILPSFWEGFGLDILSAFSLEVPVIASNVGSLPEVVGNAGILIDPNSTNSISDGIEKILNMTKTDYNKLIEKEKMQLSKFAWEKTAVITIETLRKAIE